MEEGAKAKKTIFVGGLGDDINEQILIETFSTFGDVVEVQLPLEQTPVHAAALTSKKHRGFAFVTFTSSGDASDAIDNMDQNELKGRVLRVNLARPQKVAAVGAVNRPIWEQEDWLKTYAKPLAQSGGVGARAALRAAGGQSGAADEGEDEEGQGEAMEE